MNRCLNDFIGKRQMFCLNSALKGEERDFFIKMLDELQKRIADMPHTYQTDGQGENAICYLHYFLGGSDWYIIEKDQEPDQYQAFGYAILNQDADNAELGYICIQELIDNHVELDLYFTPITLREVKEKFNCLREVA